MIVVDASVLLPAVADDGPTGDALRARLHDEVLAAPEIVDLEVASALRRGVRDGRVEPARARVAIAELVDLSIWRVPHRDVLHRAWELRENLTLYDASYVALAELLDAVLLTADGRLARAPGSRCHVERVVPSR